MSYFYSGWLRVVIQKNWKFIKQGMYLQVHFCFFYKSKLNSTQNRYRKYKKVIKLSNKFKLENKLKKKKKRTVWIHSKDFGSYSIYLVQSRSWELIQSTNIELLPSPNPPQWSQKSNGIWIWISVTFIKY